MGFYLPLKQDEFDALPYQADPINDSPKVDKIAVGNDENVLIENIDNQIALTDSNGSIKRNQISSKSFAIAMAIIF